MTEKCLNKAPGLEFLGHFALKSISCCDGGFRSFLQGDVKSFHSTFVPQSKKHRVLPDRCPVHRQQRALDASGDGWRRRLVQKQGKVLEPGDEPEHEIFL